MDSSQIEAIHESAAGQRLAQRQPLPGSVYEIVTDMLMTHAFEPGARLNIEELARTVGVSPTPVREALARVEADGLIVKQPGRSYTVAPLMGIEQVRELMGAINLHLSPEEIATLDAWMREAAAH